jgi:carbonic anhydrase
MSAIDDVLKANLAYALNHDPHTLSPHPRKRLAVLTCMDTRLDRITLGLKHGDAHMIRNAGAIATDDALRSLLVSHYLLGTQEVMVIGHTDCGLMKSSEEEIHNQIEELAGGPANVPVRFHAFKDVEKNVREQMERLASHSWIKRELVLRGFVYDVLTGHLTEVNQ